MLPTNNDQTNLVDLVEYTDVVAELERRPEHDDDCCKH